jgi:D-3-phosphoglycerate dehydrogenase / 2-oxoglutarate reductase
MSCRIWFEREQGPAVLDLLEGLAEPLGPASPGPEDPFRHVGSADAIVAGRLRYSAEVMDRAPRARVISRTGIGYDRVDVQAATRRGIVVCHTPDAPTASTAEHAVALMLAVAKRLKRWERELRLGGEDFIDRATGVELAGKVVGLIGLGRIGGRVARICRALGMAVLAWDPYVGAGSARDLEVELVGSLDELLERSDVVFLHAPLTAETRGLMDAGRIGKMRRGAILVNTARGEMVDHGSLLSALTEGHLGGVGLDVTDPEPLDPGHPLLDREDVVVTPHVATATAEARQRIAQQAVSQALQVLKGKRPPHMVNPEAWEIRRRSAQGGYG